MNTSALDEFRSHARIWLEENCPPEMRVVSPDESDICWGGRNWTFKSPAQKLWLERMVAKRWTVPTWPHEYGGGGLSRAEALVLKEEMQRIGALSPLDSFGISMLGPALLEFGTEDQKREHLPKIARGEIRWCQGYSEPNAGSDLASLQTRAVDEGDRFVVNGQKVWTSYADQADWIFCLVRTNQLAPKHRGISFLLFDMTTPGITTRPIRLISGKSPFCETFFDDVSVPKHQLLGELNEGWGIAKYLLTHERQMIGSGGTAKGPLARITLGDLARENIGVDANGRLLNAALRADIARAEIDRTCFELTIARIKDEVSMGIEIGARSAILKYFGTEEKKRRYELMMSVAGFDGLELDVEQSERNLFAQEWLRSKATSIEGGTSEIMLNIIAKNILEMAGE
ncbi:acyl-CoA dehydrogenase family protein [Caballeronia sp. SEWSISQ10-4 2]|uniref:acyl-CoA dehydrogenase family protein n=1 Tax=Caballeronia sp. SEWSISQ10-4 2 TaxID=2937438 RepID=UPI00264E1D38|nr:acyl-CoA dehydrogenase family protein [Caballeronia sp. SEWSISQ10-4 2]MDN7177099.1 acyl-CoA dehydrogenase family protein [Caballeronia sp. SEWSISQ10-4 2]